MVKRIILSAISLLIVGQLSAQKKGSNPMVPAERMVLISTEFGDMKVKLYNETPQSRDNFIKLVEKGFYDSLLFHRVIQGFMIQGGDPESKHAAPGAMLGNGDVGYTIPAEFNDSLYHKKGALCAARTETIVRAAEYVLGEGAWAWLNHQLVSPDGAAKRWDLQMQYVASRSDENLAEALAALHALEKRDG